MSRHRKPSLLRILFGLLFLLGSPGLSPHAVAMPPMCGGEPCEVYGNCGDGACDGGESCSSCPGDCGECPVNNGDGHIQCDGWDRQGACALAFVGVATGSELRRYRGGHDYSETYLTTGYNSSGLNILDGSVGYISTSPLPGQVPLYHWSSNRGYVYDLNPNVSAHDYVYRGIAGYVWPPGTNQGYPLYRTFSSEYGFFYTNFQSEIQCQLNVYWQPFVELARVNWPAPAFQSNRVCYTPYGNPLRPSCDPFIVRFCENDGGTLNYESCVCFN